jgi:hypothetical protein
MLPLHTDVKEISKKNSFFCLLESNCQIERHPEPDPKSSVRIKGSGFASKSIWNTAAYIKYHVLF